MTPELIEGAYFSYTEGPHLIEILSPHIYVENEVVEHLLSKSDTSGLPENIVKGAVQIAHFSWGTLVSLNWGLLGYAPGGVEYCLLPIGGPAISVGHLRLDWTGVHIRPST